jgi:hypothetical protein
MSVPTTADPNMYRGVGVPRVTRSELLFVSVLNSSTRLLRVPPVEEPPNRSTVRRPGSSCAQCPISFMLSPAGVARDDHAMVRVSRQCTSPSTAFPLNPPSTYTTGPTRSIAWPDRAVGAAPVVTAGAHRDVVVLRMWQSAKYLDLAECPPNMRSCKEGRAE